MGQSPAFIRPIECFDGLIYVVDIVQISNIAFPGKLVDFVEDAYGVILEIVKRNSKEFKVLPWRWIVERTFGWLNRSRRLSKDYEVKAKTSEAWIKIAMINLMIHRISKNP